MGDYGSPIYLGTPFGEATVNVYVQALLDEDVVPTTDGLAEWSATLRLTAFGGVALPDICDTNAIDLAEPNFGGRSLPGVRLFGAGGAARELVVLNCDSNAGTIEIAGGPFHEGNVFLGVGNGPGWTTLAEGFLVVPSLPVCTRELFLVPEAITATTIDPGQPGPPYQTTPVPSGGIVAVGLHLLDGICCAATDVDCSGTTGAGDIGITAGGGNFLATPPPCDRTDVDGSGTANAGDIGIIAHEYFSSTGPCICITNTPGIGGCPTP